MNRINVGGVGDFTHKLISRLKKRRDETKLRREIPSEALKKQT